MNGLAKIKVAKLINVLSTSTTDVRLASNMLR